jgi:CubicO group peptidase (beta-lactamase class C family)
MKGLAVLLFACLTPLTFYGQNIDRPKMDSLFDRLEGKNLAIGGIAVSQNGKLIYQRSFGKDQSATTGYRIGSITKMFTAVLIYQLIDEKKLSLDDTLSEYFKELPNAGKITISQMLGHRSGLANFTNNNTNYDSWKDQPKTHEELLAMIKNQKPDFEPNARADYNNSNYLLLSYILEKIYHKPYKQIVTERVIKKIGLKHTYYGDHVGFQENEAISYKYFDNRWKEDRAVYLDNFNGVGAIISTPADMCGFINALFSDMLISKNSLNIMKHMVKGYGMGMFPYGTDKHPGFGHNGKTEGFGSSLQYYPENKLSIAYCTNGEVYPKEAILNDVFNICFKQPYTIPNFDPVILNEKLLGQYTGTYSSQAGIQAITTLTGNQLILETRGQQFRLDALSEHEFWNVQYGFFFDFNKAGKQLVIKDVDDVYELDKK